MKWIRRDDMIIDSETGKLVAIIPTEDDALLSTILLLSPQILAIIVKFIIDVDSNQFKPKKTYNSFKELLSKIPEYLYDQERIVAFDE